jgi:hypothetical protein
MREPAATSKDCLTDGAPRDSRHWWRAAWAALLCLAATGAIAAQPPQAGRYQVFNVSAAPGNPAMTLMVDTATGQTWMLQWTTLSDKSKEPVWTFLMYNGQVMLPPPLPTGEPVR